MKKYLHSTLKPTSAFSRMLKHKGDVSESSRANILGERTILGKKVIFYKDGSRRVINEDINDEEAFDSELLKLAHASLLTNKAVGDKSFCYVDATLNPVKVILYGMPAEEFIKRASNKLRIDDFMSQSIGKSVNNVRNV